MTPKLEHCTQNYQNIMFTKLENGNKTFFQFKSEWKSGQRHFQHIQ